MKKFSYVFLVLFSVSSTYAAQMAESKDSAALLEEFDAFMTSRGTSAQGASDDLLIETKRILSIKPGMATDLLLRVAPFKKIKVIRYLIDNGADMFAKDEYGYDLEKHLKGMTPGEFKRMLPSIKKEREELLELIQKQKSSTVIHHGPVGVK